MGKPPGRGFSLRRLALAVAAAALCLGSAQWVPLPAMMFPIAAIAPAVVLRPKLAWIVPLVLPVGFVLGIYTVMENYCFFYPSIDTVYAPGYTEEAFDRVPIGASAEVVRAAFGEPLSTMRSEERPGEEIWSYTHDGKCRWGDWAWFARYIVVKEGRVESKFREILYD